MRLKKKTYQFHINQDQFNLLENKYLPKALYKKATHLSPRSEFCSLLYKLLGLDQTEVCLLFTTVEKYEEDNNIKQHKKNRLFHKLVSLLDIIDGHEYFSIGPGDVVQASSKAEYQAYMEAERQFPELPTQINATTLRIWNSKYGEEFGYLETSDFYDDSHKMKNRATAKPIMENTND